ncbi:MAG: hypothetical protein H6893_12170 [Brucellaceae bacterium]|nr:hypothetical protein [Brucellaceae bacterium]
MLIRKIADIVDANRRLRGLKNLRNEAVDLSFRARGRKRGLAFVDRLRGDDVRNVAFAIAFNTPWVIDFLTAAWERNVENMRLVVLDNSSSRDARAKHREICAARGVPYLGLPYNPEWNPNRSHGIAMNWAFHNVAAHLHPELVGFIDHDCFPVDAFDFAAQMNGKSLYGWKLNADKHPGAWCFWAGFSFFRFAELAGKRLDFKHSVELGLDTGGRNWPILYSYVEPQAVLGASMDVVVERVGDAEARLMRFDKAFVHLAGASYAETFSGTEFRAALARHLWATYLPDRQPVLAL